MQFTQGEIEYEIYRLANLRAYLYISVFLFFNKMAKSFLDLGVEKAMPK